MDRRGFVHTMSPVSSNTIWTGAREAGHEERLLLGNILPLALGHSLIVQDCPVDPKDTKWIIISQHFENYNRKKNISIHRILKISLCLRYRVPDPVFGQNRIHITGLNRGSPTNGRGRYTNISGQDDSGYLQAGLNIITERYWNRSRAFPNRKLALCL